MPKTPCTDECFVTPKNQIQGLLDAYDELEEWQIVNELVRIASLIDPARTHSSAGARLIENTDCHR